jgi:hypothetical protein
MGELMNALTKYAESDPTKDPGVDGPEVPDTKGKKPVGSKCQQQAMIESVKAQKPGQNWWLIPMQVLSSRRVVLITELLSHRTLRSS